MLIYNFSSSPFENQIEMAWAAALVLVLLVLADQSRRPESLANATLPTRSEYAWSTTTPAAARRPPSPRPNDVVIDCDIKELYYGTFKAVRDTQDPHQKGPITAFIGPSGCGKSTVLRCLNRMNDLVRGFRFEGHVHFRGKDIYHPGIDPVAVRRYIGMVFQQPNPFAMSIYRNVAFGLRLNGYKGDKAEKVEQALRGAALWDEVKDKLHNSGLRSPAGSSSGCASPGPSPPSPRCC